MIRTSCYYLLFACVSCLLMLSAAKASVALSTHISTANFAVSPDQLKITGALINSSGDQTLLSASANAWLDLRQNSIRLSPVMGVAGKSIIPARRVPVQPQVVEVFAGATAMAPTLQQAKLPAVGESIPDPAPLGFLGLGLIALALTRRRRRKAGVATPSQEHKAEPEPLPIAA